MPPISQEEQKQEAHYDKIAKDYERHYYDKYSQQYRIEFIHEPMTKNIKLEGARTLEAMCGSGSVVPFLIERGAKVAGLDISSQALEIFKKKWPDCEAIQASMLDTKIPENSFDLIVIVGGLHHAHPYVEGVINEVHRILKPGGYFCFFEPHAGSFPDRVRNIWYKADKLFEKNEKAIDLESLMLKNSNKFNFIKTIYFGNLAHLLVFNSFVFRIPLKLKKFYSPPFMVIERLINKLNSRLLSCNVVCQWQKK